MQFGINRTSLEEQRQSTNGLSRSFGKNEPIEQFYERHGKNPAVNTHKTVRTYAMHNGFCLP